MIFIDVILPLPLHEVYTYSIPEEMQANVKIGSRVIVQFGAKKLYTAIVFRIYEAEPKEGIKEVSILLDEDPTVTQNQLNLWQWVASYYMCTLGDVYKAALPSALKIESETYVVRNPDYESNESFTPNELKIFHALSDTSATRIQEIEKKSSIRSVISTVKSLVDKGAAFISEDVTRDYKAKRITAIRLAKSFTEEEIDNVFNSIKKLKKQEKLLLAYFDLKSDKELVLKNELLKKADVTNSVLDSLVRKEILEIYQHEVNRIDYGSANLETANKLNSHQQKAYEEINASFQQKDVTLLFGVTSSGKTEIYIQLIKDCIAKGKQALYLLPEIALTTQITERLKAIFGNKLAVYHSKFNENERAEVWTNLLQNKETQVVLGARSAIFLPFTNLGLVIVDEEHESSYKQQDPAPRYNARNLSMILANMYQAKTLLGTATPSIESYYNALNGRYGLVRLTQRHEDIPLPEIQVVNVKELRRTKRMKSILSPPLIQEMDAALTRKEQIILFQNRRGFSSMLECKTCSWTPHCLHCDVSLTYHKGQNLLICHYCGATYSVPTLCPECDTPTIETVGYGTERIEEEVSEQFPQTKTLRMDLDTTRGKRAYERIITDFAAHKASILIGTQMVSKGLDFDNVSVVGILNADNMLNYPDFRAHERAFQMIMQVSGRAGRKNKRGLVALQTSHPGSPVIQAAVSNDYQSFYELQLEERQLFRYPPFFRLIAIYVRGKNEMVVDIASRKFSEALRSSFGERVLGPSKPPVARVQTLHIRKILLKIEHQASINDVRTAIKHHQQVIFTQSDFKSLLVHFDVDPV